MTGVITIAVWQVVQLAALAVLGFGGWKLYCRLDDRREKRREAAFEVAVELEKRGMKRVPRILRAYAVGNYSGMWDEIKDFARSVKDGPELIAKEFEAIFSYQLKQKLATKEGLALVKAEVAAVEALPAVA
jgi:hypothetical protein